MRNFLALSLAAFALAARADGPADNVIENVRPVPPRGVAIPNELRAELTAGADRLGKDIEKARAEMKASDPARALLPDVAIFHKAVDWALRYGEFLNPTNEPVAARSLLRFGAERLEQLRSGMPQWVSATGLVVRGYVSKLDGSIQPYGLVVPATYQANSPHAYRLDVWFHGRDEKLTELNFLNQRMRSYGEFTPRNTIVLHTYSRFCNGQKLAGEVDLFEALEDVKRNYSIDENRILVRGFSLGGAACWQIAAHYPSLWAAAAPGAGFSETPEFLKVFQQETMQPAWYEQKLWHQYNATDYALNFFNLPTVAYSGEIDSQKQAADAMALAVQTERLELTHIIGPQTRHSYHPAAKTEVNRRIDAIAERGRDPMPRQVRFTTWTLRYNKCHWLTVDALEKQWDRARIVADLMPDNSLRVDLQNISGFTINMTAGQAPFAPALPIKVVIGGKAIEAGVPPSDRSWNMSFHKTMAGWTRGAAEPALSKRHGLQGPIDDAFMDSFLVVRPSGRAANPKVGAWVQAEMTHFTNEWRRHFRGEARVKDDKAVTPADIAEHNLILWGDPSSNELLGKIAAKLPIGWNGQNVSIAGRKVTDGQYVPALIFPNPLNPAKYVVINSGFTIREYDYLNNARQVPKLPDWALIDIATAPNSRWPGKIVDAGFFGEHWELIDKR